MTNETLPREYGNLKVYNHEYMNTGGHCMVSIFDVYDKQHKRTLFLMVNEEGGSLVSGDYIRGEIDFEDTYLLETFSIDTLEVNHSYYLMYRDCWFEYVKKDYADSKTTARVRFDLLPTELFDTIDPDYVAWCMKESDGCIETDGERVIADEEYYKQCESIEIKSVRLLLEYMHSEFTNGHTMGDAALERFENLPITIGFGDKTIVLSCSAAAYTGIEDALQYILDQQ